MLFAFVFDSIGVGEWFVLLAVVLVVVGPRRLPETARKVGRYYAKFRRAADAFKRQLLEMDTEFNRVVDDAANEAARPFEVDPDMSEYVPPVEEPPPESSEPAAPSAEEPPAEEKKVPDGD